DGHPEIGVDESHAREARGDRHADGELGQHAREEERDEHDVSPADGPARDGVAPGAARAKARAVAPVATVRLLRSGPSNSPRATTRRQKAEVGAVTTRAGRSPNSAGPGARETINTR